MSTSDCGLWSPTGWVGVLTSVRYVMDVHVHVYVCVRTDDSGWSTARQRTRL